MKPETEKRLAYALLGGGLIPVIFYVLAEHPGIFSQYAQLPISLPVVLYKYLFPPRAGAASMFADLPGQGFWVFLVMGNFILYFLSIYLGLWWKQRKSMPHLR